MNEGKPERYVIFGAGAIGGALAALLARAGLRVACVARAAQAAAFRAGVTLQRGDEEFIQRVEAVTAARDLPPADGDVIIITVKSQATEEATGELAAVYPQATPVVSLQNGVTNEAVIARRFAKVYAGLVFFSATQIQPTRIALTRGRSLAVGCYPEGVDETARHISEDFERAGFAAMASPFTMAMKWSKFVVNLNNATYTITGTFVEQGAADDELRRLLAEVREEGLRVLDAARIAVEPPAGEPSLIRIRELHEKAKAPPADMEALRNLPEHERTYPSMWQDLMLGRRTSEADHLNGVIVELGRQHGVPTPYNSTLLEIVNRMFATGERPGLYTPAELRALIESRRATEL
ncbi:MAG TPA: 2-dehydropantoate 2-reductase [Blastocatellia bacterium]|nr:2-dehydropantoate 2-reductase [Blastocatellia bacterium]